MKQLLILTASLFILIACNPEKSQTSRPFKEFNHADIESKVDALIKQYTDMDIFSGVVLIAQDGKPCYHKAFGMADRSKQIPNKLSTKFVIGSMNKTFTELVILQLIEQGKLNYSDKMVDFLEGFEQADAPEITIEHLLTHRSGFGDYHNEAYWNTPYEQKNIQGLTELIKKLELNFPPGAENEYSNAGFILLGAIIEKVTHKSFAQNVEERITKPLGLKNTFLSNVKATPERAIGYLKQVDGVMDNEEFITEPRSDGGFYATAEDVMNFYRHYFYGEKIIKKTTRAASPFMKQVEPFAAQSGKGIPIAGGFNGANTVHLEMIADNISIVVMANMDEPVAEKVCFGIQDIINGKVPAKPSLPAKLNLHLAYKTHGIDYIKANFDSLTVNFYAEDPKDLILNNLGYDMLQTDKTEDAIALFKLNTELFPEVANCWDSYGEAVLKKGDKKAALAAYKKALKLNPHIPTAKAAVAELEK